MNVQINGLVSRIVGIITILITVVLIAPIYTSNAGIATAITSASNTASFLVLPTLLPFGPIIILLGLLFMGGLLIFKAQDMQVGVNYMVGIVISVVGVIIVLSVFPAFIKSLNTTLTTVIASNDTIGELFLGTVIPLLLYLTVAIAPSITPAYQAVKNRIKGKSKGKSSSAMAY